MNRILDVAKLFAQTVALESSLLESGFYTKNAIVLVKEVFKDIEEDAVEFSPPEREQVHNI